MELVNASANDAARAVLGNWSHLDLSIGGGGGAMLSAKTLGDQMFVLVEVKDVPEGAGGGCCADTLRVYEKDASAKDLDLDALLAETFGASVAWVHATHTFDAFLEENKAVVLLQVQYSDADIGGAKVNAIVKVDVAAGTAVDTKDGDAYWSIESKLGAETYDYNSTVYKMQYVNESFGADSEEWHGNGILKRRRQGPWTYGAADGADAILQRFGTSPFASGDDNGDAPTYHHFGLPAHAEWTGGVHNVWYTASSKTTSGGLRGKESITMFINSIDGRAGSFVFEFELKLAPQEKATAVSDAGFGGVAFAYAECHFKAQAMGGARARRRRLPRRVRRRLRRRLPGHRHRELDEQQDGHVPRRLGLRHEPLRPYTRIVVD
ncbi:hypothetical protein JL722_10855 [Aureococcus anophagefferens]|nr:hypothetical protein JL722_10855 [Aureococcus anophagefferens]